MVQRAPRPPEGLVRPGARFGFSGRTAGVWFQPRRSTAPRPATRPCYQPWFVTADQLCAGPLGTTVHLPLPAQCVSSSVPEQADDHLLARPAHRARPDPLARSGRRRLQPVGDDAPFGGRVSRVELRRRSRLVGRSSGQRCGPHDRCGAGFVRGRPRLRRTTLRERRDPSA